MKLNTKEETYTNTHPNTKTHIYKHEVKYTFTNIEHINTCTNTNTHTLTYTHYSICASTWRAERLNKYG